MDHLDYLGLLDHLDLLDHPAELNNSIHPDHLSGMKLKKVIQNDDNLQNVQKNKSATAICKICKKFV